jgi:hypothetical protein
MKSGAANRTLESDTAVAAINRLVESASGVAKVPSSRNCGSHTPIAAMPRDTAGRAPARMASTGSSMPISTNPRAEAAKGAFTRETPADANARHSQRYSGLFT